MGVSEEDFENVVFIFAKGRIENWIQFLNTGTTHESVAGPRVKKDSEAVEAAKKLAKICLSHDPVPSNMPLSLLWSCKNWQTLVRRMKNS
jgi:hypothetical protein